MHGDNKQQEEKWTNGKKLLCSFSFTNRFRGSSRRSFQIFAEDLGAEKQHEAILSADNQNILWSPRHFDQADKSCFTVGPGVYIPSGFVWSNVTSQCHVKYIHPGGESPFSTTFQLSNTDFTSVALNLICLPPGVAALLIHTGSLFSSWWLCSSNRCSFTKKNNIKSNPVLDSNLLHANVFWWKFTTGKTVYGLFIYWFLLSICVLL